MFLHITCYVNDTLRYININAEGLLWPTISELDCCLLDPRLDMALVQASRTLLSVAISLFKDMDIHGMTLESLIMATSEGNM